MRLTYRMLGCALALTVGYHWAAPRDASSAASPVGKIKFCSDLKFSKCKTALSAGEDIYLRVEFPSSVLKVFQDSFGEDKVRSTGKYALAIAKNIEDENPIVTSAGQLMISRYKDQNTLDLTMQASAATIEKIAAGGDDIAKSIPFNSITTMGNGGTSMLWSQKAMKFADGRSDWEAFLIFIPEAGDPQLVAQAKFSYAIDKASRKLLGAGSLEAAKYEQVADDGISTGVHKANVGRIVFGGKKMKKDFDDKGALQSSVKSLGAGLYARVYMKASAKNILAEEGLGQGVGEGDTWTQLTIAVGGKISRVIDDHLRGNEALKFTSFSLTLVPGNPSDAEDMPSITRKFVYLMSTLGKGKHKVTLSYALKNIGGTDIVFATGELEVDIAIKDRDDVARKWGNQLPGRGLLDSEKGLAKELKAIWPKIPAFRAPWGWQVVAGATVYRTTTVVSAYKQKNGECTMDLSLIRQDQSGSGFGKAYLPGPVPPQTLDSDLPCQNLEK